MTLYEHYAALCAELRKHECESCGGPAQHVDPDDSKYCFDCMETQVVNPGAATHPGMVYDGSEDDRGGDAT